MNSFKRVNSFPGRKREKPGNETRARAAKSSLHCLGIYTAFNMISSSTLTHRGPKKISLLYKCSFTTSDNKEP